MKLIGVIGGMSWESTAEYYRLLNEMVASRLGGLHSARLLVYSVDFAEVEELQKLGDWEQAERLLSEIARQLELAGADLLVIASNTMHRVADSVERAVTIPLLHIADVTGKAVIAAGLSRVALLGTRFTMEEDFYRGRLEKSFGVQVLVPSKEMGQRMDRIIFEELCLGQIIDSSRAFAFDLIKTLQARGAQGVILGCTELPFLIRPEDSPLPVFDTTALHCQAAVEQAMAKD